MVKSRNDNINLCTTFGLSSPSLKKLYFYQQYSKIISTNIP